MDDSSYPVSKPQPTSKETTMIRSQDTSADQREIQAHLCAYNSAFEELDLMFRWDANTLASLAGAPDDHARVAAYIESHCPHLLTAYSAEFLCQAIVEKKNAWYDACRANTVARIDPAGGARMWRSAA
jgi:hypothetical protein